MKKNILIDKYDILKKAIASYREVAIAFSAGVDSTFLLHTAKEVLGDKVLAITAKSVLMPALEEDEAEAYCQKNDIRQIVFTPDVFAVEGFADNPPERCYLCKKQLFSQMKEIAENEGVRMLLDGSNSDDEGDFRPGMKALEELKIHSPLREFGFTKKEIRSLAHAIGLEVWDKPAYACLATRVPYGEILDPSKLQLVEKAEAYLRSLGFVEVRVRVHNTVNARIELNPNDFARFMRGDVRLEVNQRLKSMGFAYVSLDLQGYRTGSLNEVLPESV